MVATRRTYERGDASLVSKDDADKAVSPPRARNPKKGVQSGRIAKPSTTSTTPSKKKSAKTKASKKKGKANASRVKAAQDEPAPAAQPQDGAIPAPPEPAILTTTNTQLKSKMAPPRLPLDPATAPSAHSPATTQSSPYKSGAFEYRKPTVQSPDTPDHLTFDDRQRARATAMDELAKDREVPKPGPVGSSNEKSTSLPNTATFPPEEKVVPPKRSNTLPTDTAQPLSASEHTPMNPLAQLPQASGPVNGQPVDCATGVPSPHGPAAAAAFSMTDVALEHIAQTAAHIQRGTSAIGAPVHFGIHIGHSLDGRSPTSPVYSALSRPPTTDGALGHIAQTAAHIQRLHSAIGAPTPFGHHFGHFLDGRSPTSPEYSALSPPYRAPTSPVDTVLSPPYGTAPDSPVDTVLSPLYNGRAPASPVDTGLSPLYAPTSPVDNILSPTHDGRAPDSPGYTAISPVHSDAGPPYSPSLFGEENEDDAEASKTPVTPTLALPKSPAVIKAVPASSSEPKAAESAPSSSEAINEHSKKVEALMMQTLQGRIDEVWAGPVSSGQEAQNEMEQLSAMTKEMTARAMQTLGRRFDERFAGPGPSEQQAQIRVDRDPWITEEAGARMVQRFQENFNTSLAEKNLIESGEIESVVDEILHRATVQARRTAAERVVKEEEGEAEHAEEPPWSARTHRPDDEDLS